MRKIARTSVIIFGVALCGPVLATSAAAAEPEARINLAEEPRGRVSLCLLCWPGH